MTPDEIKAKQREERTQCICRILDSKARKKLIVAGPGTGKTHTFLELLKLKQGGTNLVMTFIRKLTLDMEPRLSPFAEVKTFHAYCKKILHETKGKVELVPYLTKVVERDAELLGFALQDFDLKLQRLEEGAAEIKFYLGRGDYYSVVSFNDSVFRLYKALQEDLNIVPQFDQILVDEYQDFNALEVAFLRELEKRGPILIVGDDDQAIYRSREASPGYLRALYRSGEYETFPLPFCGRCPQVIVAAMNVIVTAAQREGFFEGRIEKRYECYFEEKERDSVRFPKLIYVRCTTAKVIPKYIASEIAKIDHEDIAESMKDGDEYPTVLVVGERQYLREVYDQLQESYSQVSYSPNKDISYGLAEGYEQLLGNKDSNLGWRILMEWFKEEEAQREILLKSEMGIPLMELLDDEFVQNHKSLLEPLRLIRGGEVVSETQAKILRDAIGAEYEGVMDHFKTVKQADGPKLDRSKPRILLTSFQGCKGMSAGHVFIVGVHEGSMPRSNRKIQDVEISEFVVALTRTRKQCHVVSSQWLFSPMSRHGDWLPRYEESRLVSWLPAELIENRGVLKASNFSSG